MSKKKQKSPRHEITVSYSCADFAGGIPEALGALTQLLIVYLHTNELTGERFASEEKLL